MMHALSLVLLQLCSDRVDSYPSLLLRYYSDLGNTVHHEGSVEAPPQWQGAIAAPSILRRFLNLKHCYVLTVELFMDINYLCSVRTQRGQTEVAVDP